MRFTKIDIDEISKKLDIKNKAINQGRKGLPTKKDQELDQPQKEIVEYMRNTLSEERQMVIETLNNYQQKRQDIESFIKFIPVDLVVGEAEHEIEQNKQNSRDDLIEIKKKERKSFRGLRSFERKNDLNRDAIYPESKIFHWAVIIAAIVIESIANSYFFAKGSDMGLLGGVFQALLISMANIGSALFMGVYILPFMNHQNLTKKILSISTVSIYAILIFFFNLATAHYRAQLETDPIHAILKAITQLVNHPFGIVNYEAWVLFVMGLLFASFALIKGYTSDDSYPGYGPIYRAYQESIDQYKHERRKITNEINASINKYNGDVLTGLVKEAHKNMMEYPDLNNQSEERTTAFKNYARDLESSCNTLLQEYRIINNEIQGNTPPEYFSKKYVFNETYKTVHDAGLESAKQKEEELRTEVQKIDEKATNIQKDLQALNRKTLDSINKFFHDIEEEVENIMEEEAKEKWEEKETA